MQFDWSTLALQTVNVLILCWLLHRFLYKPILSVMDARRSVVEGELANAAAVQGKAKAELASLEAQRRDIARERDAALAEATIQADAQAKARLADAERQARAIIEEGRRALAAERATALDDAKAATLDLAVAIAGQLLAALPVRLRGGQWINVIEDHLARLPTTERQSLREGLAKGGRIRVTTADPLPAADEMEWRRRLGNALGEDLAVEFAVDPQLLGGAELLFPGAVLRLSWKDALGRLRTELVAHGDAV